LVDSKLVKGSISAWKESDIHPLIDAIDASSWAEVVIGVGICERWIEIIDGVEIGAGVCTKVAGPTIKSSRGTGKIHPGKAAVVAGAEISIQAAINTASSAPICRTSSCYRARIRPST
jgi:hypothetical protein